MVTIHDKKMRREFNRFYFFMIALFIVFSPVALIMAAVDIVFNLRNLKYYAGWEVRQREKEGKKERRINAEHKTAIDEK